MASEMLEVLKVVGNLVVAQGVDQAHESGVGAVAAIGDLGRESGARPCRLPGVVHICLRPAAIRKSEVALPKVHHCGSAWPRNIVTTTGTTASSQKATWAIISFAVQPEEVGIAMPSPIAATADRNGAHVATTCARMSSRHATITTMIASCTADPHSLPGCVQEYPVSGSACDPWGRSHIAPGIARSG